MHRTLVFVLLVAALCLGLSGCNDGGGGALKNNNPGDKNVKYSAFPLQAARIKPSQQLCCVPFFRLHINANKGDVGRVWIV